MTAESEKLKKVDEMINMTNAEANKIVSGSNKEATDAVKKITAEKNGKKQVAFVLRNGDVVSDKGQKTPMTEEQFMAQCEKMGLVLTVEKTGLAD